MADAARSCWPISRNGNGLRASIGRDYTTQNGCDARSSPDRPRNQDSIRLLPYRIIHQTFHGMRDVLGHVADDPSTAILPFSMPAWQRLSESSWKRVRRRLCSGWGCLTDSTNKPAANALRQHIVEQGSKYFGESPHLSKFRPTIAVSSCRIPRRCTRCRARWDWIMGCLPNGRPRRDRLAQSLSVGGPSLLLSLRTSASSNFDFRISRFGASHGSVAKTGANAQTANVTNPKVESRRSTRLEQAVRNDVAERGPHSEADPPSADCPRTASQAHAPKANDLRQPQVHLS